MQNLREAGEMRNPPKTGTRAFRCAIYTRKSSEEGLEQDFNSLHAQRESCEAYIKSQRHEGWTAPSRPLRRRRVFRRINGPTSPQEAARRYSIAPDRRGRRLQSGPADPVAGGFRKNRRNLRRGGRLVRLGHPAIQHHDLDGAPYPQCPFVLCAVRARGHRRADPRQDRRLQAEGHVDGRLGTDRLRPQGPHPHHQRNRGPDRPNDLRPLSQTPERPAGPDRA